MLLLCLTHWVSFTFCIESEWNSYIVHGLSALQVKEDEKQDKGCMFQYRLIWRQEWTPAVWLMSIIVPSDEDCSRYYIVILWIFAQFDDIGQVEEITANPTIYFIVRDPFLYYRSLKLPQYTYKRRNNFATTSSNQRMISPISCSHSWAASRRVNTLWFMRPL